MSSFNNNPYTYTPGTNRLLDPSYTPSLYDEAYVFNAANSLVQDAVAFGVPVLDPQGFFVGNGLFYDLKTQAGTSEPPQNAPSIPQAISQPTSTSIVVVFNSALVGGNPPPNFSVNYGLSPASLTSLIVFKASPDLALYVATATGLQPDTNYYFQSVARNSSGSKESAFAQISTAAGGGGTAPSAAPTVPAVSGSPTASSITVTFDVAGITGTPAPSYNALIGSTTSPVTPIAASLVSGTTYKAVATGLAPNTTYYFKSEASNGVSPNAVSAVSDPITTGPTVPSVLTNILPLTFLVLTGTEWRIDTDGNAGCGSIYLTGTNAGTIIGPPDQTTSLASLASWNSLAQNYMIISFGGATQDLEAALPNPTAARDFVDSFWNQILGVSGAPNPLTWNNVATGVFWGLDLDFESATVSGDVTFALVDQWKANVAAFAGSLGYKPYLTFTPQTPNSWLNAPSSQPWTNNNSNIPFTFSGSALSTLASGFNESQALLAGAQLAVADFVFAQIYNQVDQYLTKAPAYTVYNPVFTTQMAQWAYLIMLARRKNSGNTKLIWAFSSSTEGVTTPVWTTANQAQLNEAINLINPLVSAQLVADGLGPCAASEWSGGIGFWTSPTGNTAAEAAFSYQSAITKANMAGDATMLWMEAAYPSPNPLWATAPMSIVDNRGP